MAPSTQGASTPNDYVLPVVVQFKHYHEVRVETDERGAQRVVARVKPGSPLARPTKMRDLPFVGQPAGWSHLSWWYFPKATNWKEADERGKFFWDQFVTFARGARHRRAEEARGLVRYILEAMPRYEAGQQEAQVFIERMAEALVAHLRVGLEDGPAPGRKGRAKAASTEVAA